MLECLSDSSLGNMAIGGLVLDCERFQKALDYIEDVGKVGMLLDA